MLLIQTCLLLLYCSATLSIPDEDQEEDQVGFMSDFDSIFQQELQNGALANLEPLKRRRPPVEQLQQPNENQSLERRSSEHDSDAYPNPFDDFFYNVHSKFGDDFPNFFTNSADLMKTFGTSFHANDDEERGPSPNYDRHRVQATDAPPTAIVQRPKAKEYSALNRSNHIHYPKQYAKKASKSPAAAVISRSTTVQTTTTTTTTTNTTTTTKTTTTFSTAASSTTTRTTTTAASRTTSVATSATSAEVKPFTASKVYFKSVDDPKITPGPVYFKNIVLIDTNDWKPSQWAVSGSTTSARVTAPTRSSTSTTPITALPTSPSTTQNLLPKTPPAPRHFNHVLPESRPESRPVSRPELRPESRPESRRSRKRAERYKNRRNLVAQLKNMVSERATQLVRTARRRKILTGALFMLPYTTFLLPTKK